MDRIHGKIFTEADLLAIAAIAGANEEAIKKAIEERDTAGEATFPAEKPVIVLEGSDRASLAAAYSYKGCGEELKRSDEKIEGYLKDLEDVQNWLNDPDHTPTER